MTYPKPKNEEEKKKFRRFDYEEQKEGLIEFHKSEGYDPNIKCTPCQGHSVFYFPKIWTLSFSRISGFVQ